ncbi:MAG: FKBP-type peptidyl-prolyl cis-trans isomerase [Tannerellaceae bacterium]|jgi:peptidylprolyl isomerase/FKBP-type peptidyl-prolyl cis-trans isomerase FklB|nr:FKBP-type peptidyl-prolyl cis-trans isomerase [Tannerellaceae bacterium]
MKKYQYLFMMICCATVFISCGNDNVVVDEVWKKQNEDFILNLSFNTEYNRISSQSNAGSIYYKVLKEGTGTSPIYYTDSVRVYYKGSLITGEVFDEGRQYLEEEPATFTVAGVADGFSTALQRMKEGDRWLVWMPYELGYGTTGDLSGKIKPYSALCFDMEVVEIIK